MERDSIIGLDNLSPGRFMYPFYINVDSPHLKAQNDDQTATLQSDVDLTVGQDHGSEALDCSAGFGA